jgi:nicotinamidase/pyrazinamidase
MPLKIDRSRDALIVVDVQYDFLPGGTLPVATGLEIIPVINKLIPYFQHVFFTRDWHPDAHISFSEFPEYKDQSWPPHCVADTPGAMLYEDLAMPEHPHIINKGTDPNREAYSGFEETRLEADLRDLGIKRVFICGLATEYCVKNTVLDAVKRGFQTYVIEDGIRGINHPAGTVETAMAEMKQKGAVLVQSADIIPTAK